MGYGTWDMDMAMGYGPIWAHGAHGTHGARLYNNSKYGAHMGPRAPWVPWAPWAHMGPYPIAISISHVPYPISHISFYLFYLVACLFDSVFYYGLTINLIYSSNHFNICF